jgi:hypothetical protein
MPAKRSLHRVIATAVRAYEDLITAFDVFLLLMQHIVDGMVISYFRQCHNEAEINVRLINKNKAIILDAMQILIARKSQMILFFKIHDIYTSKNC